MANKIKPKQKKVENVGFDVQLTKAEAFFEKNGKLIIGIIVAIIIIVLCLLGIKKCKASEEEEAQNAIALCQQSFAKQDFEKALKGDGAQSKGFIKIIDEYSGTKTANLAKIYAAICVLQNDTTASQKTFDEAIKYLKDFDVQDDNTISAAAIAMLGNCLVSKNDKAGGAEKLVEAAEKANNEALSPLFLIQAGEIYEEMKQNDKALELYEKIKNDYPQSPVSLGTDPTQNIDVLIERVKK